MATIWKAVLKMDEVQEVEVPSGAEILCAREQHERICIWFCCDPTNKTESRTIGIAMTGHPTPEEDDGRYLGTASLQGGNLMFHVFERRQKP